MILDFLDRYRELGERIFDRRLGSYLPMSATHSILIPKVMSAHLSGRSLYCQLTFPAELGLRSWACLYGLHPLLP